MTSWHTASSQSGSLSPLPSTVRDGLIGVTVLSFISFFACTSVVILLLCRIVVWKSRGHRATQVFLLILNLQIANVCQSFAFLLSTHWLRKNKIDAASSVCWTQGWFTSVGSLASGFWCLAIAFCSFGSVVYGYELSMRRFTCSILALWAFILLVSTVGNTIHPGTLYTRAGLLVSCLHLARNQGGRPRVSY